MKLTKSAQGFYEVENIRPIHGIDEGWVIRHIVGSDYTAIWNTEIPNSDHAVDYSQCGDVRPANLLQAAAWIINSARESDSLRERIEASRAQAT